MRNQASALVENFYNVTTTRQMQKFVVRLPLSESPENLGEICNIAIRVLKSVYKRVTPSQRLQYDNFMKEYLVLGHMSLIPANQILTKPHRYLPHNAVFKNSCTTSLHVVFNTSKKRNQESH